MGKHSITLVRGDGVGPELAAVTKDCLDATGVEINWDLQEAGVDIMETAGTPLLQCIVQQALEVEAAVSGREIWGVGGEERGTRADRH